MLAQKAKSVKDINGFFGTKVHVMVKPTFLTQTNETQVSNWQSVDTLKKWVKKPAKYQASDVSQNKPMNYQFLTGLSVVGAALALPTVAFAATTTNPNQPTASVASSFTVDNDDRATAPVTSQQLIAQSVGRASFYGNEPGEGGPLTANGERYNPGGYTAAHRSLPFGTRVRVTSQATGRSVVVRINDRGPFVGGRSLDLSVGAARAIGLTNLGVGTVRMDVLGGGEGGSRRHRHRVRHHRHQRHYNY